MNWIPRIAILFLVFFFWAILVTICEAATGEDIPKWATVVMGGLTMAAVYIYPRGVSNG